MVFGRRGEKFLSLDIGTDRTSGLFFELTGDREIRIEKFESDINLTKFLKSPRYRASQASWEGKYFFAGRRRIVAAADATLATTVPVPFSYDREPERQSRPLSVDELDDRIGEALPKILAQCRVEVARRLMVEPIEAVLVGAQTAHITIDGKPTDHPAGFLGASVSLALELTFVRRDIFESFRMLFNAPDPFSFFESPDAITRLLALVAPLPVNLIVPRGEDNGGGGLFVWQPTNPKLRRSMPVMYREKFPWSFDDVMREIMAMYAVSRPVAHDMYRAFVAGGLSPAAERHIGAVVAPFARAFLGLAQKAKLRGTTFSLAPYPLPFTLPRREGLTHIAPIPLAEIFEKFDITLVPGPLAERTDILLRHLAPFFMMYFDRARGALNDRLRRKVHWLTN